jgi:hypothetical protein
MVSCIRSTMITAWGIDQPTVTASQRVTGRVPGAPGGSKDDAMPHDPAQPAAERDEPLVDDVRARVAATNAQVQRTHRRTSQAMAQVRYVDRLLHASPERVAAVTHAKATEAAPFTAVMEHEVAAHGQAVELHGQAARLQDEAGWPERVAAARAHAARARKLSRRARAELARF